MKQTKINVRFHCLIRNSHQSVFTADKHQTLQHDWNTSIQLTTHVLTAAMLGNQTRVLIQLQIDEQTFLTRHKSKQSSNTSISNNRSENQPESKVSKTGLSCSLQSSDGQNQQNQKPSNHNRTDPTDPVRPARCVLVSRQKAQIIWSYVDGLNTHTHTHLQRRQEVV